MGEEKQTATKPSGGNVHILRLHPQGLQCGEEGVRWALAFRPVFMLPLFGPHSGTPHCHCTYRMVATRRGHRGLL